MNRRTLGLGTLGAIGTALVEMRDASAKVKRGLCQPCGGGGECESGFCGDGKCRPLTNICEATGHKNFKCKGNRPKCCDKRGCVSI